MNKSMKAYIGGTSALIITYRDRVNAIFATAGDSKEAELIRSSKLMITKL